MRDPLDGLETTVDRLTGSWRIHQLRRGHRFSSDDQLCAWRATLAAPRARQLLDLGCGVGSVGLIALHRLVEASRLTGIEAQPVSVALARRTVATNGLTDRVRLIEGDLRDPGVLPSDARFDLITGSPPYFPRGTAVESPIPQRAGARVELRGSVVDYCAAARRWAAPGARFAFVMTAADPRTEQAPAEHGWAVLERLDVVFAPGRDPLVAVLVCARTDEGPHPPRVERRLVIRGGDGQHTATYLAVRRVLSEGWSVDREGAEPGRHQLQ